jgi:hypothetical protein
MKELEIITKDRTIKIQVNDNDRIVVTLDTLSGYGTQSISIKEFIEAYKHKS